MKSSIKRLVFDIETVAVPNVEALLPAVSAPGNLKDPEKIAAAIAEKRQKMIDEAALDPDLCQVKAISMLIIPNGHRRVFLVGDKRTPNEYALLRLFWNAFAECGGNAIGYNILGFDFPVILRRSFALKLKRFVRPNLARYQTEPITDLYGILYGWQPGRGLKWTCKRYDIPNELPDLDGSMVKNMTDDTLREYAFNDLNLTEKLYRRMDGVYYGHLHSEG